MSILSEIFSWWGGNTWGTRFTIWKIASQVGEDEFGNRYYLQRSGVGPLGKPRRFVVYKDLADASKVPAEWHGWLHYTVDDLPDENYKPRAWQKPHKMNMTGTGKAYRPKGSILRPQKRERATGDYKAWKPE
ncbi:NADH:ubiquinone oxidoreductase 17.2 kD subunit [Candidatus Filomicrobium marinum]|uniref:NADH:ubiquinone oxidoreductase 17.2 kD subunit n=2 Tax=Filomicrobium TaxID=119044 RepID=A0A0D6JGU5_9HYPH|nr:MULTISPECIES: NADH:ubiquinone oxidoreductase subunit NDUFA12 [Filomicrobium]MCV0369743.1 NADH:ubiquinone oxidoreductase subunit NDUFA12 [Filomicrobium sp.]CFX49353.1 NADH:ubiquinone oxidoreductase 17.2 kD subunit [Candidatus Filomicrobium marinum]CPR20345.1 NADH:ubiquinone oxidoreductase 17.2 kD subunit [Candidatus Filomicrobium marinum]SDP13658.1 NADH:ubiquinone oxidoreductase subunit [Filomicrobium insigne]